MMSKHFILGGALCIALIAGGCSAVKLSTSTKSGTTFTKTPPKVSNTAPNPNAAKKEIPASAKVEVPKEWETYYDEVKGYEFKLPKDSKAEDNSVEGVDAYYYRPPAPSDINVYLAVYKDKTLSKDDLFKDAADFSQASGDKDYTTTNRKDLNDDYSIADYTLTEKDGKKRKGKVLVGIDKTDNYIMFVDADANKYEADAKTVDEIWSSFSMYSGGASGVGGDAKKP
jgi:hypothetical protein